MLLLFLRTNKSEETGAERLALGDVMGSGVAPEWETDRVVQGVGGEELFSAVWRMESSFWSHRAANIKEFPAL